LNTDSELLDVYITSTDDKVGNAGSDHVLDITFNDQTWTAAGSGNTAGSPDDGLEASGFTLVETAIDSGIFVGTFQIPSTYYDAGSATTVTTTGTDIEVNYNDHRDASGETIEVGAGASLMLTLVQYHLIEMCIQYHGVMIPQMKDSHCTQLQPNLLIGHHPILQHHIVLLRVM
jgi:hypothetical protein